MKRFGSAPPWHRSVPRSGHWSWMMVIAWLIGSMLPLGTGSIAFAQAPTGELAIIKSASPSPTVQAGGTLIYTLVITNNDAADDNPIVSDPLPAPLANASISFQITPNQGFCQVVNGTVLCNLQTLAAGQSITVQITIQVPANAGGTVTNTATVAGNRQDRVPANNSGSATTTILSRADLSITKSASPKTGVLPGQNVNYTLTVVNGGLGTAYGTVVSDVLPNDVVFVSATSPCGASGQTVTCALGPVASGATIILTITVQVVASPSQTTISNTATVSLDTTQSFDPDPSNNSSSDTFTLGQSADLSILASDSPDPVRPATTLTYSIAITNTGPSAVNNVQFTYTLPPNVTPGATTIPGTCSGSYPTFTCDLGPLAANAGFSFTISVQVNPGTPDGAVLDFSAGVSNTDGIADSNSRNNNAFISTNVVAPALSIDKQVQTLAAGSAIPGEVITYTLTVRSGNVALTNVVVNDPIPANTTYTGFSNPAATLSGSTLIFNVGSLAANSSRTLVFSVQVSPTAVPGTTISNQANGTSTETGATPVQSDDPGTGATPDPTVVTVVAPTAVSELHFVATRAGVDVRLSWQTTPEDELDIDKFVVYRSTSRDEAGKVQVREILSSGRGQLTDQAYSYVDSNVGSQIWWYWLEVVHPGGSRTLYGPISGGAAPVFVPLLAR